MKNKIPKVLMIDSLIGNDYSLFLCNELKRQGLDISLVMTEDRKIKIDTNFDIKHIMPSKDSKKSKLNKLFSFPIYFFNILRVILNENYNIVHYQFFRYKSLESIFYILLKLLPTKLFHTAHDVVLVNEKKINILYNKLIYLFSDAIIVHSEKNKNQLREYYKIPDDKIYVTPHGSFDFYESANNVSRDSMRNGLSIPENQIVFLFFGFIKEYKGLDVLLEAFKRIIDFNLTIIIAGEFESEKLGRNILDQIGGLPSNITVIPKFGFVEAEQIPLYFTSCDVVVLPYKTISHSGVLHLAYSFSKPVLATDVGDFDESVINMKSGFLVRSNDPEDMCNTVKDIASGKYDLQSLGIFAKELNDSKYTWNNSAQKLIEVYKRVLD